MAGQTDCNSMVKHPNHYNVYDVEVLDMMAAIWGNEAVALWCKMTAFKYRMRMGYKKGVDITFDFKKEQECLELMRKYQALSEKENSDNLSTVEPSNCVSYTEGEQSIFSSSTIDAGFKYNPQK